MADQTDNANMFFQVDPRDPKRFAIVVTRGFVVDAYEAVAIANRMIARAFECDPEMAVRSLKGLVEEALEGTLIADHAPPATPMPPADDDDDAPITVSSELVRSSLRMPQPRRTTQPRRGLKSPPRKPGV